MRAYYPYCPYYQALADAPAGAWAIACASAVRMCGCGNKANKGNKNITIYYMEIHRTPIANIPPLLPKGAVPPRAWVFL